MNVRLIPTLIAAAALAGCSSTAARQPVSMPFTGTWHQEPATESHAPAGFLAIDSERVIFNLDGQPRGQVSITTNETDPALRSGRLVCADGRTLFLAVGDSITDQVSGDRRVLTPSRHLDVHCFAPGAKPTDAPQATLRLWPSATLAVTAYAHQMPPTPSTPSAFIPAATAHPVDRRFTDAVAATRDPFLTTVAAQITAARADGVDAAGLDALYQRCTVVVRSDILRDLDAARRGDQTALPRADRRLSDLASADDAYDHWRSQR